MASSVWGALDFLLLMFIVQPGRIGVTSSSPFHVRPPHGRCGSGRLDPHAGRVDRNRDGRAGRRRAGAARRPTCAAQKRGGTWLAADWLLRVHLLGTLILRHPPVDQEADSDGRPHHGWLMVL